MSGLIYLSSLFVIFGKGIADLEIIPRHVSTISCPFAPCRLFYNQAPICANSGGLTDECQKLSSLGLHLQMPCKNYSKNTYSIW